MNEVVISELTKKSINDLITSPSHAVLIVGGRGTGKLTIAKEIAQNILGTSSSDKLLQNPYFMIVSPLDKTISIDSIRDLKAFFRLKTTGVNKIRRIVVIENAETMTDEAQNAVLKILEEPPSDSMIILTSQTEKQLNRTIISRVQLIRIYRPDIDKVAAHFSRMSYSEEEIRRGYALSNGSIGLMNDLLDKNSETEIFQYIEDAKEILGSTRLEKLLNVEKLSSDRVELTDRLYSIKRVCRAGLSQAIKNSQTTLIPRWLNSLNQVEKAEKALSDGANVKLLLTDLLANL